jgi:hypothetical protein
MKRILALIALATLATAGAQAQTSLKLPQSSREYLELLRGSESDECPGCGVVTSVREVGGGAPAAPATPPAGMPSTGTGIGGEGAPSSPLFARETREYHESVRRPAAAYYVVTVRFFDGGYGEYSQIDKPAVQRGDRVRLVQDRVEPIR